MKKICDTSALLFWADRKEGLTVRAREAMEQGQAEGSLACSDMSFCEIAMLFRKGRLALPPHHSWASYMQDIVESLRLTVLPITPDIAALAESGIVPHGDPGDRIIAATAIHFRIPLITADQKLLELPKPETIW